jgi:cell division protein FtsB
LTFASEPQRQQQQQQQEIEQLRDTIVALTAQCAQLDEANRAWLVYQQTQIDTFVDKLRAQVTLDPMTSFDQIADILVDQLTEQRLHSNQLEQTAHDLRSGNRR